MFSHECFGEGLRKLGHSSELEKRHKEEMFEMGWRERLFEMGDRYLEDVKKM